MGRDTIMSVQVVAMETVLDIITVYHYTALIEIAVKERDRLPERFIPYLLLWKRGI
jgi:hypothetical protein